MDDGSKPDPVIVTTVPPFKHVPGVTVMVAAPLVAVDGCALHGTVVVVVVGAVVVVVVDAVVVVVVVVVLGGLAPASAANTRTPASPVTMATDPMSPNRTSLLKRRILTPRAFIRPFE
jgi:hypothetical protein